MTIKSQSEYKCPDCQNAWLPYARGLACPFCKRSVPDAEVTPIIDEALESAKFNKRLYGHIDVEYWNARRLGDNYLKWGFTALQAAEENPDASPHALAIGALMSMDLESLSAHRDHVAGFLEALIERFREQKKSNPAEWEKMPEPDKTFQQIVQDMRDKSKI